LKYPGRSALRETGQSLPRGERGLKFDLSPQLRPKQQVAPPAGSED